MATSEQIHTAFRRYQIAAWTVGVFLAFMGLIALPLKYIFDVIIPGYAIGWQIHGFLFMVYLLMTTDLGVKTRMPVMRMLLTAIWGTVPLMSFVAERRLRRDYAPKA